jgi:hypothetical protein
VYSTIRNKMVRQPATAMMALFFERDGKRPAHPIGLATLTDYGRQKDILGGSFYLNYLADLDYIEPWGNGYIGSARLEVERDYLRWLAERWPVQTEQDKNEVIKFRNAIMTHVWLHENAHPRKPRELVHGSVVAAASRHSNHPKVRSLAEHAIHGLMAEGIVKLQADVTIGAQVYYLNELPADGGVVVKPRTALTLHALLANTVTTSHDIRLEDLLKHLIQQRVSLHDALQDLEFAEQAGYLTATRIGPSAPGSPAPPIVSVWRTERAREQEGYITYLAEQYGRP